ncbi:MAG: hypothetical protein V7606_2144 [Burkholderiales bacterium]
MGSSAAFTAGIAAGRCFYNNMNKLVVSLAMLAALAGCAHRSGEKAHDPSAKQARLDSKLAVFSSYAPGGLPIEWEPMIILRTKKLTDYQLVTDRGRSVLHAKSSSAASGLIHHVNVDPLKNPWLNWKWKVDKLIKTADNTQRATEDSAVRIVLGFDGDKDALPFTDQIMFETAKVLTGRDVPYATLIYIWENKAPVGTVIPNSRSGRIQKLVVSSGPEGTGQWREFTRNIVEDYEQAFGEKPGRLIGVGVLTDTDNTGETVEAWYGDIRLLRERR